MLCRAQTVLTGSPSASFKTLIFCSSLNRLCFIFVLPSSSRRTLLLLRPVFRGQVRTCSLLRQVPPRHHLAIYVASSASRRDIHRLLGSRIEKQVCLSHSHSRNVLLTFSSSRPSRIE